MISEQLTVTTTPTTIKELLETARSVADFKPTKCVGIKLRCAATETVTVALTDENSVIGAVVLDAAGENLVVANFKQFNIDKALLSCSAGTITVHIIVEQTLV